MRTIATLFAGGGGVECGAVAAGLTPIWAVEYDADIAKWHGVNFPDSRVIVSPVQCVDPATLPRPDVLHASPPCPNFSVAKAGGEETAEDVAMAEAVCHFLRVLTPETFTLENVQGYRKSQSYQRILCTLDELGYWTHSDVINAADYGVPQTRKRLVLRASLNGLPAPLPPKERWIGWYEAIEDLIPTLPESKFADWQLARLPEELTQFLQGNGTRSMPVPDNEPANTITSNSNQMGVRAFLVEGDAAGDRCLTICETDAPAFTVKTAGGGRVHRAFLYNPAHDDDLNGQDEPAPTISTSHECGKYRAWLSQGRVVSMTPRALARFQSFPDWYKLPENKTLAGKIIGNAVPPRLYERIAAL